MYDAAAEHASLTHKFTGKERDSESGLDNFGARYNSSSMGRFMSPDWSAAPMGVPYADFGNPQSLNLYSYVKNNPVTATDPDGHCCEETLQWGEELVQSGNPVGEVIGTLVIGGALIGAAVTNPTVVETGGKIVDAYVNSGGHSSSPYYGPIQNENTSDSKPGTLGKADHQQTVKEEAAKYPKGQTEVTVETPGGEKGSRRIDAANVENGKVTDATQVIRPNKNGTPPARKVRAANDIEKATGVKPKMVPVRPCTNNNTSGCSK